MGVKEHERVQIMTFYWTECAKPENMNTHSAVGLFESMISSSSIAR